ncbi:hypothetical protein [Demetria terragena]|uniref:hypothetical protein n=1 Tax=Demetria terragena TaxID=63959 RepID=UPI0003819C17|nr:hypothetical protein [Demetria terragena]
MTDEPHPPALLLFGLSLLFTLLGPVVSIGIYAGCWTLADPDTCESTSLLSLYLSFGAPVPLAITGMVWSARRLAVGTPHPLRPMTYAGSAVGVVAFGVLILWALASGS